MSTLTALDRLGGQVWTLSHRLRRTSQAAASARNRCGSLVQRLYLAGQDAVAVELEAIIKTFDAALDAADDQE